MLLAYHCQRLELATYWCTTSAHMSTCDETCGCHESRHIAGVGLPAPGEGCFLPQPHHLRRPGYFPFQEPLDDLQCLVPCCAGHCCDQCMIDSSSTEVLCMWRRRPHAGRQRVRGWAVGCVRQRQRLAAPVARGVHHPWRRPRCPFILMNPGSSVALWHQVDLQMTGGVHHLRQCAR